MVADGHRPSSMMDWVGRDLVCHAAHLVQAATAANGRAADRVHLFASLRRLWAVQTMAHSARTLSMPRIRNWRNPRACLICPNTGSGSCLRNRQGLAWPPALIFARMASTRVAYPSGCSEGGAARA